ncbi:pyridoxal phosphate-dependent aminotransferase [Peptoniphilus sp. KCTC 25270]|uniref:pyridoxal phosphate-dependent aminotransferase n=1 Tax=Peptoniphilus sp. KCTC 25270 TaxID=2897414 RepID=UPI001E395AE2|nr:pyridoxal phosphate-dependent aminotransferase [Peptoniphilus sp. KCTC 25270]MCD1147692.1 pyridoxal phosphate-dependent aminotransferase [Peptoniphilus sp. KCTC 25270]
MERSLISKKYQTITPTAMGGSGDIASSMPNLVNFSLGDPDVTTPEKIIDLAFADAKKGHTHYTSFYGDEELIDEIVRFQKEEYGLNISRENVFITTSACHGMWLALEGLLDEGDEVIIPDPYFTPYPSQVELCGGVPVFLPTYEEEEFQISLERLEERITEKTKAIIVNTPNNPTGACLSKERLEAIGALAKKHNFIVISDDIYTSFSYEEEFFPLNTLEDSFSHTVTLRSFSKNYAMTGWRLGYIIADASFIKVVKEINENNVFTAPSISQRAGIYAIRYRKEFQPELIETYKKRTFYAYERIKRLKNASMLEPKGTFYLFVNIKETGLSSEEVADRLVKEAQVLTIPGDAFGKCGEGYIRLAVTVDEKAIDEAFDRIEKMDIFGGKK